jgi:hypothetical protein
MRASFYRGMFVGWSLVLHNTAATEKSWYLLFFPEIPVHRSLSAGTVEYMGMSSAMILTLTGGNRNPEELDFRPIGILRDMIADVELAGYAVKYNVELDTPSKAAISYDLYAADNIKAGPVNEERALEWRAVAPAVINRPSSIAALTALVVGQVEAISIDPMNTNGRYDLDVSELVAADYELPQRAYRIITHTASVRGNVVLDIEDDEDDEDENLVFDGDGNAMIIKPARLVFHPFNSTALVNIPPALYGVATLGTELDLQLRTITVQINNIVAWVEQKIFTSYFDLLAAKDRLVPFVPGD